MIHPPKQDDSKISPHGNPSQYRFLAGRFSFDIAAWVHDDLPMHGGSAYLLQAVAAPQEAAGPFFEIVGAPVFHRRRLVVAKSAVAEGWTWFAPVLAALSAPVDTRRRNGPTIKS